VRKPKTATRLKAALIMGRSKKLLSYSARFLGGFPVAVGEDGGQQR